MLNDVFVSIEFQCQFQPTFLSHEDHLNVIPVFH